MPKRKESALAQEEHSSSTSLDSRVESLKKILKANKDVFGKTPYYLHSGHYGLDYIMSGRVEGGGYPGGKVVEVFGPRSTGKTLLLIYAVKNMQKEGGIVIVADVERRWKRDFAEHHGVDWDNLIGWSPNTVEAFTTQTMDALEELPDDGKVLICLDSLASLTTIWELESQATKEDQGKKAKRIHASMRVLPELLSQKGAILLVANHTIEKPNVMFGPNYGTSGGNAVPFQASVRIELFRPRDKTIEGKERPLGVTLNVFCDKNSETAPFGRTKMDMLWVKGIDPYSGLV